jgi:hypothetical protein
VKSRLPEDRAHATMAGSVGGCPYYLRISLLQVNSDMKVVFDDDRAFA